MYERPCNPMSWSAWWLRSGLNKMNKITPKLWEARYRRHRSQSLQLNTHFAAFFEIYKSCILLHRSDLKISAKNASKIWLKWNEMNVHFISFSQKSMNFAVFLRDFDKFLSEFHGYSQKITNLFQILRKNARKIWKNAGNFRKLCRFHSFSSLVQSYP